WAVWISLSHSFSSGCSAQPDSPQSRTPAPRWVALVDSWTAPAEVSLTYWYTRRNYAKGWYARSHQRHRRSCGFGRKPSCAVRPVDRLLLCHKSLGMAITAEVTDRRQHGHRGSIAVSRRAISQRRVASEFGACRSGLVWRAARAEAFGRVRRLRPPAWS